MVDVLFYLYSNNHYHGDLRTRNILLNEEGAVKVLDSLYFPYSLNNFGKFVRYSDENVYLSPEQLKILR